MNSEATSSDEVVSQSSDCRYGSLRPMTSTFPVSSDERDVASALQDPIDIITITLQQVQELKNKQALIEKLRKELISSSDVEPRVT